MKAYQKCTASIFYIKYYNKASRGDLLPGDDSHGFPIFPPLQMTSSEIHSLLAIRKYNKVFFHVQSSEAF